MNASAHAPTTPAAAIAGEELKLLPRDEWLFETVPGAVILGAWERRGYLWYEKFALADLPNDLISSDDLERGINT